MKNNAPKRIPAVKYLPLFAGAGILIVAAIFYLYGEKSNPLDSNHRITRKQALEDLDQLQRLLEEKYSYLQTKGVDYKAELNAVRDSLGDEITCGEMSLKLMKFLALFGDGHSSVSSSGVSLKSLCSDFSPFLLEESGSKLVAFKSDRSGLLDPNCPYLRTIDGLPVDSWLRAGGRFATKGSPQYFRYHSIRNLRYIALLRKELELDKTGPVEIELESADGSSTEKLELPLTKDCPIYGVWPRPEEQITSLEETKVEYRILEPNIGYMRFVFMPDEAEFNDALIDTMGGFARTDGLIIDIRSNGGGRRTPLKILMPFFMAQNDSPRVVNVAAYRLGRENIKEDFEARYLYPADSTHWSSAEKDAIQQFAAGFRPEWDLPQGLFSPWHYFVISPEKDSRYYHYDKPVVILMDKWNFSACDIFLGAFKGMENLTLMGQPSGGGSGCFQPYRLKNSAIKINLSSMASFQPSGKLYDGNGIQPDITVEPVPTDFIGQSDTTLEAAIRFIKEKTKP
ncbi:MAG: hypothetical protein JW715_04280 [Sedimentisphaerales bacterium]|nr:hypothetical protein [Sedimentisphaerales bacterium]